MVEIRKAIDGSTSVHHIVTPEGVELPFRVAALGDRLLAFLVDCLMQAVCIFMIGVLSVGSGPKAPLVSFLSYLAFFAVWNLYFIVFELRWQGQTPGKRYRRMRVIDRRGGPLTSDAVIVRNLMRQVELFVPLGVLLAPIGVFGTAPKWLVVGGSIWLIVLLLWPLFNKRHLRIGDLVGGTIVVCTRKVALDRELSTVSKGNGPQPAFSFKREQLEMYGVYELQVLEDLIRRLDGERPPFEIVDDVAARIQKKIGWTWPDTAGRPNGALFLRAFYAAQRERLEKRLLLGERREHK